MTTCHPLQADTGAAATPGAAAATVENGGGAAGEAPAASGSSGGMVELSVKWNKQEIVIHLEPDESVQVGSASAPTRPGAGPRDLGRW